MNSILWTQVYFALHLAGLLFSASLEIISLMYESGMQKWLSQDEDIERIGYYRRIRDSGQVRWASYSRITRGLITVCGTIALLLVMAIGNWLFAKDSPIFTVHIGQDALTGLVSSLFTAEASFLGIAFIVFVLLIERLSGNEYLDRSTFRRFMRKSLTAQLLAASVTLLVLTGIVLYWISSGSEVSTIDHSLLFGVGWLLVLLAGWVVKVAFTGIDFATPGQIFVELKRELQGIIEREVKREERARKANGKLNQVILSYEEDPAPTSPLLLRGRDAPEYFLEGEQEVTIRPESYDQVVYDANLQKLETIMQELIRGDRYPPIRAELALMVGDVVPDRHDVEKITVAYVDEGVSGHVISALENLFEFRPIPPLATEDPAESIEKMAVLSIEDGSHQKLTRALKQVSDLQSKVLRFRTEKLDQFLRGASFSDPKSRLSDNFLDVLNRTGKVAIEQGGKDSISIVMETWGEIVQDTVKQKGQEVLLLYTHVLNGWVKKADEQLRDRHVRFGDELEETWVSTSLEALSSLQDKTWKLQENIYAEKCRELKLLEREALHFEYIIAQGWYLIRERIDESSVDRVHWAWDHGRTRLSGYSTLPISEMKGELEQAKIAIRLGSADQRIRNGKKNLDAALKYLNRLQLQQRSLRVAALTYALQRLRERKIDASKFKELIGALRIRHSRHYRFANEFRFAMENVDRQGAVSEAFSRSGLKITEEMVEGYVLCALWSINPESPPESEDNSNAVQRLLERAHEPSGVRPVIALPNRLVEIGSKFINQLNREPGPDMSAVLPDRMEQRLEILKNMYLSS